MVLFKEMFPARGYMQPLHGEVLITLANILRINLCFHVLRWWFFICGDDSPVLNDPYDMRMGYLPSQVYPPLHPHIMRGNYMG